MNISVVSDSFYESMFQSNVIFYCIFHTLKKNVNKILLNIFLVRENYF